MIIKIKGLDSLDSKIKTIIKELPGNIEKSILEVLKNTCEYAIRLRRGDKSDGILFEMVDISNKKIKGRIYTDQDKFPYSWYEHYGTGRYAELDHVGVTKHFIESGYEEWFIPVHKVTKILPYPIIMIQGEQFYLAHGVKPNPFLQQAEFEMRDTNLDLIQENMLEMLRKVCK